MMFNANPATSHTRAIGARYGHTHIAYVIIRVRAALRTIETAGCARTPLKGRAAETEAVVKITNIGTSHNAAISVKYHSVRVKLTFETRPSNLSRLQPKIELPLSCSYGDAKGSKQQQYVAPPHGIVSREQRPL